MYYGESIFDNDHIKFELSRADRKAANGWRFRHRKGMSSRILIAAWAGAKGLVRKALRMGGLGGESMNPEFSKLAHV
jgi:hypothetical protein